VYVTNRSTNAVEIYAVAGGTSYRMGTVPPGLSADFTLRPAMLASGGRVEFVAEQPGGARRITSGAMQLSPGNIVDFEIATQAAGSSAVIRN
jgi:hypothetical protein